MNYERILPHTTEREIVREAASKSPLHLVFAGASSTGKTTMMEILSTQIGVPTIPETARSIIKEQGWKREDLDNAATLYDLQQRIVTKQYEQEIVLAHVPHCSDRSIFDPLVYAEMYLGLEAMEKLKQMPEYSGIDTIYKNALFIVIEPNERTFRNDGVRILPDIQFAREFNNRIKRILEDYKLPYIEIHSASIHEREEEIYRKLAQKLLL